MKAFYLFLACMVSCLIWGIIFSGAIAAADVVSQVVNVVPNPDSKPFLGGAIDWLSSNWAIVALVVSEVAALLPTKVNGIVQGALKFIGSFFTKK